MPSTADMDFIRRDARGVEFYRVGKGRAPTKGIPCWRIDQKLGPGGDRVGFIYRVVDLPVGPRVNGGVGFIPPNRSPTKEAFYRPDFWTNLGWRTVDQLPEKCECCGKSWEGHNADVEEKYHELLRSRDSQRGLMDLIHRQGLAMDRIANLVAIDTENPAAAVRAAKGK